MDIKEIALKVAQATNLHYIVTSEKHTNDDWNIRFADAIISAYKAELLKEVGEPVAFMCSDEELCHKGYERFSRHNSGEWNISVFTSDQVAAAIQQYKDSLLKDVGEPVAYMTTDEEGSASMLFFDRAEALKYSGDEEPVNLFTESQLAAAQEEWNQCSGLLDDAHRSIEMLEDQLATAEQRVAEACALQVATETKFHWLDAARVAKEIRSGEWRKFVKEV